MTSHPADRRPGARGVRDGARTARNDEAGVGVGARKGEARRALEWMPGRLVIWSRYYLVRRRQDDLSIRVVVVVVVYFSWRFLAVARRPRSIGRRGWSGVEGSNPPTKAPARTAGRDARSIMRAIPMVMEGAVARLGSARLVALENRWPMRCLPTDLWGPVRCSACSFVALDIGPSQRTDPF